MRDKKSIREKLLEMMHVAGACPKSRRWVNRQPKDKTLSDLWREAAYESGAEWNEWLLREVHLIMPGEELTFDEYLNFSIPAIYRRARWMMKEVWVYQTPPVKVTLSIRPGSVTLVNPVVF